MVDPSRRTFRWTILASGCALATWLTLGLQVAGQPGTSPQYNSEAELLAPMGFEHWVFVGSNLGMTYKKELPTMTAREAKRGDRRVFHNVYINREAYAHFETTQKFPEPTILTMEMFAAADKEPKDFLSAGVYNGQRVGLEVAVKNSSRPKATPAAWAYYDFTDDDPSKITLSAAAKDDDSCHACHLKHAGLDNVWVQFYPALRQFLK